MEDTLNFKKSKRPSMVWTRRRLWIDIAFLLGGGYKGKII